MTRYIARRVLYAVLTVFGISVVAFVIIELPPGDFLTTMMDQLASQGSAGADQIAVLREHYGLNEPFYVRYWTWISGIVLHGDFGQSFVWKRPVSELIADRLPLTAALAFSTLLFTWVVGVPIGIYSAMRQ